MWRQLSIEPAGCEFFARVFGIFGSALAKGPGVDGHFWQHVAGKGRQPVRAHQNVATGCLGLSSRIVQLTFWIKHVKTTALANLELLQVGRAGVFVVLDGL